MKEKMQNYCIFTCILMKVMLSFEPDNAEVVKLVYTLS